MADSPVSPAPMPVQLARWTPQPLPAAAPVSYTGKLLVGRYMMLRKIGGGGMSSIHEARDINLGMRCVVKILRDDLPIDPVDRFHREAHVLASFQHDHIARIIDRHDIEDGPRFIVTEYIDGVTLGFLRRRGPVPAAVVHQIGLQVSAALAYAHAAGVTHRDINPANLMLVRHPGGDAFAKVIDFGIAKLAAGSELAAPANAPPRVRRATRGDVVLGTAPYYCGHEGRQRDVYALALTLAELLTGEPPDPTVDLGARSVPPALARVLEAALRSDEFTTMDAFHHALREADDQPLAAAEAERRRYVARALADAGPPVAQAKPAAADHERFAGRYILHAELGRGGMGQVQLAFDTETRRQVALKTIHPRHAGMRNLEHRFRREARALAAITHPGAPQLYDLGAAPEPYFTMEIVDGVTLASTLKHGKLDPLRALTLAIDLAGILKAAHDVGVVHRDVKPDNIVIGHGDRVRLLDFGACLLLPLFHQRHLLFPATPADERYETGELEVVGTPGYTAPEVLDLSGRTSPRSDIYSVCAVLYEMLSGRPLADRVAARTAIVERREFPAELGPVADLLRQGTAREPTDRPWTMIELGRSLEILRADLQRLRERRNLLGVAAGVLAIAAVLVVSVVLVLAAPDAPTIAEARPAPPALAEPVVTGPPVVTTPPIVTEPPAVTAPPAVTIEPPVVGPAVPSVHSPDEGATSISTSAGTPPAPPVVLTRALVEARVARRHAALREQCGAQILSFTLEIMNGRATLRTVNGMALAPENKLHRCVRDQLAGLHFPRARVPGTFPLTLNLKEPP